MLIKDIKGKFRGKTDWLGNKVKREDKQGRDVIIFMGMVINGTVEQQEGVRDRRQERLKGIFNLGYRKTRTMTRGNTEIKYWFFRILSGHQYYKNLPQPPLTSPHYTRDPQGDFGLKSFSQREGQFALKSLPPPILRN